MDVTEKDYDADEVLAKLRKSLEKINLEPESTNSNDTLVFNNIDLHNCLSGSQDTITVTGSNYSNAIYTTASVGTTMGTGYSLNGLANTTFTINSGAGVSSPWANTGSTKIKLEGEEADIEINGKSLAQTIQALEERLNILVPNPELEKEWIELKELGDKYRVLESKLMEQGKMWKKLKEMPPPEPLY